MTHATVAAAATGPTPSLPTLPASGRSRRGTPAAESALQAVIVLGVTWVHDERAGEQGYALAYHPEGDPSAVGVTLLADERSDRDPPLYRYDTVELRRIGTHRHSITRNLTMARAATAERIDWVSIALTAHAKPLTLAPAQVAVSANEDEALRDEFYARKFPDIAAWLGLRKARTDNPHATRLPPASPDNDGLPPVEWPELPDNGGW